MQNVKKQFDIVIIVEQKTKIRLVAIYFIYSVTVLVIWAFLSYGPFWHRDLLDISQQNIPLKWYEYIQDYLFYLLLPAFFGLFSPLIMLSINKGQKSGPGYFKVALAIGIIITYVAFAFGSLGRIDCDNYCAAYIPSYAADNVMAIMTIPPLCVFPFYILYKFKILSVQKPFNKLPQQFSKSGKKWMS